MNFWRKKAREDMDYVMTPSTSKASSVGSEGGAQDHLTPARRAAVEALLERYRAHAAGGSTHSLTDDDSEVRWAVITLDICAHINSPELQRWAHPRLYPLRGWRDPGRAVLCSFRGRPPYRPDASREIGTGSSWSSGFYIPATFSVLVACGTGRLRRIGTHSAVAWE